MLPLWWRRIRSNRSKTCTVRSSIGSPALTLEALESREVPSAALVSAADPSFATASATANGQSQISPEHALSSDGKYTVFISLGSNLVANETTNTSLVTPASTQNVYLFNSQTKVTTLISHDSGSATEQGNDASFNPVISADGSTVAFFSKATDLINGDTVTAGTVQLYLYDVNTGNLTLVTADSTTPTSGSNATNPFIPATPTNAYGLVNTLGYYGGIQTNQFGDGPLTGAGEGLPSLSSDGTYVAFITNAPDLGYSIPLAASNQAPVDEVYLYDRSTNTLTLVSHADTSAATGASSAAGSGFASTVAISGDGSTIAFTAQFDNLISGDTVDGINDQLYVWSRINNTNVTGLSAGQTVLASHQSGNDTTGTKINGALFALGFTVADTPASLSNNGAFIAYYDAGQDLVVDSSGLSMGGNPGVLNVFRYTVMTNTNELVSHVAGDPTTAGDNPQNQLAPNGLGPAEATGPVISASGRYIAYANNSSNLLSTSAPFTTNGGPYDGRDQVYLYDETTKTNTLDSYQTPGSAGSPPTPSPTGGTAPAMSSDGRFVSYIDWAYPTVTIPAPTSAEGDVRVLDTQALTPPTIPPSVGTAFDPTVDSTSNSLIFAPTVMSADGGHVAWDGNSTTNVANDINSALDVFLATTPPSPPTDIVLNTTEAADLNSTTVGQLTTTASPPGRIFQYALVPGPGSTNNLLFVVNNLGQLQTVSNFVALLAANPLSTLSIRLQTVDASDPSSSFTKVFTISVVQAPTSLTISQSTVPNSASTQFANFTVSGPTPGRTYQYSLVPGFGDNSKFNINQSTGDISTSATFSPGSITEFVIQVEVQDSALPGLFFVQQFTLTLGSSSAPATPVLTLPSIGVVGFQGTPVLLNVVASPGDATSIVSLTISGVPAGVTFSAGTNNGNGSWTFTQAQLAGLMINVPTPESFTLAVVATATSPSGATSTVSGMLPVTMQIATPTITVSAPTVADPSSPVMIGVISTAPGTEVFQSVTVNWGDGTVQTFPGAPSTYTHQYPLANASYTITVSVTDQNGTFTDPTTAVVSAVLPTAQQAVVASLYQDILGRNADPSGLAGWSGQLTAGVPVAQVVSGIVASPEYQTKVLNDLYLKYLGRPVDAVGIAAWLPVLQTSGPTAVAAGLISSPEFYANAGGTPQGFVQALYLDVLGRFPDPTSAANDVMAIQLGASLQQIALSVLNSTEAATDAVNQMYLTFLGRAADPSALAGWVQLYITNPAGFLPAFLSSPEIAQRAAAGTLPLAVATTNMTTTTTVA
jgi:hypothetical protein